MSGRNSRKFVTNNGKKQAVQSLSIEQQSWKGPIPPPVILKDFDEVYPGAAEIIIKMAQQQQNHRITMEGKQANLQFKAVHTYRFGLIAGFILSLTAVSGAIYIAITGGSTPVAVSLVSLPVLGMVKMLVARNNNK